MRLSAFKIICVWEQAEIRII